ncbi:MAG: glycosyltransferase family 1 protein, partial [Bacteroidales bacterium]|nr:glycosyltransferase family 1 protein [Bacteroidales bacterium]
MRFIFTIQGEGRGHFTQALSLSSILRKHGHEVVGVLVGKSKSRQIPEFFSEKIDAPIHAFESPNFTTFYKNK